MVKKVKKVRIDYTNRQEKNKKEYLKLLYLGIFFLFVIIGTSYAFLSSVNNSKVKTEMVSGTLKIEYQDSNSINLNNASPLTDQEGMLLDSYTFTIKNTGTLDGKYNITIEEKEGNTLDKRYIKYSIKEGNGNWSAPAYLNTGLILTSNKILASQKEITYQLKMWLDENAPNEVQGQKYDGKIVVSTVQTNADLKDIENPIIILNGNTTINIEQNQEFIDPGISKITDKADLKIEDVTKRYEYFDGTNTIEVEGIDTTKLGIYYIYYEITDKDGNKGLATRIINIVKKDENAPTISLIGDEVITLNYGEQYVEYGATATDVEDGNLTDKIIIEGTVRKEIPGVYIIKYIIIDSNGNTSSVTREVVVKNKYKDLQITVEKEETSIIVNKVYVNAYTESEKAKYAIVTHDGKPNDGEYKQFDEKVEGKFSTIIDVVKNGKYTIWVQDENGKIDSKKITVTNIDETKPTCEFEDIKYAGLNVEKEIKLTCTDVADISNTDLKESSLKISDDAAKITKISKEKIENGYVYKIGLKATKKGEFNIELLEDSIKDKANNSNEKVTSKQIHVSYVDFIKDEITLDISKNDQYRIEVIGEYTGDITYTVEDESIVEVDNDIIKALKPGKTKVIVEESNGNVKDEIIVNVEKTLTATFETHGNGIVGISKHSAICKLTSSNPTECSVEAPTIEVEEGYKAIGWNTDKNSHTGTYDIVLSDSATYYTIVRKNAITLTAKFDANGATLSDTKDRTCILEEVYNAEVQETSCTVTTPIITGSSNTPIVVGYSEGIAETTDENLIPSGGELELTATNNQHTWYAITKSDPITYKVTYEKNGVGVDKIGSTTDSCTIPTTYNGKKQDDTCDVTLPEITTKEGFTKIGWNEDKTSHTGSKIGEKYAIGKDTILYAISRKDAITLKAKFEKNGLGVTSIGKTSASCILKEVYNNEEQATSCHIDLPTIEVKEGYTVLGWSKDKATHDDYILIKDGVTLTERENTYYSISRKDAITLTFHVKENGSTLSSTDDLSCVLEAVYNNEEQATKCDVKYPTITREGFDILGYSTVQDNQDLDYEYIENTATRSMDISENGTTYYANTKKDVSATWNSNGAVLTSTKSSCTIWNDRTKCSVTTPEITRESFEIIGWSLNKDATETDEIIGMNKTIDLTESKTYYAITKKNITITFNKNNAISQDESTEEEVTRSCIIRNSATSCNITSPKIVGNNNTPITVGYNEDKDATTSTYDETSSMAFSEDKKFYAITKSDPITYEVTYEKNGVGVEIIGKTADSCTIPTTYNGKKQDDTCDVTLPEITTKEGFTEIGWNEDKTSHTGSKIGEKYPIGKDTILYAISRKDAITLNAKFVKNGLGVTAIGKTSDSCILEAVYNNEEQATTCHIDLPTIEVEGLWKVLGWSEDKATHSDYTRIDDGITLSKLETTLYSISKKDELTLSATFDANGATLSTNEGISCTLEEVYNNEVRDDFCILTTPSVTRDNFDFIGYNTNSDSHENDKAYDKDANQIKLDVNNTDNLWYAITKRDLTVKYNKNGPTTIGKEIDSCTIWNNRTTCSVTLPSIERDTFDILGWNENKDADVTSVDTIRVNTTINIDEHKQFYAITKKDIEIKYYKNNSVGQTNSIGKIVYDEYVTRNCTINNRNETCSITSPSIVAGTITPHILGYGPTANSTTSAWNEFEEKNVTDSANYYAVTKNDDITYTANFIKQGLGVTSIGSTNASCTIKATYNGTVQPNSCSISLPTISVEEGYTALGWSTDKNATTDYITATTLDLTSDITLYAISKKDEIILKGIFKKNGAVSQTYAYEGGIKTSTDEIVEVPCKLEEAFNNNRQETTCTISSPIINASENTPKVIGYAEDKMATTYDVAINSPIILTRTTTYYAITKKDAVTFSASFNENNAKLSSIVDLSCTIGATYNGEKQLEECQVNAPTITAPENTPIVVGFNLDKDDNTNNEKYNTTTKKLTLNKENTGSIWYAITKKDIVTYTVNYKIGDHVTSISKTTGKCNIPETYNGKKQTTVCIIREDDAENNPKITPNIGYTSIGWSQLSSSTVGSPAVVLSKDNMTFYAHAQANTYNINYISDSALFSTMKVTYDEPFTLKTVKQLNLTKRGYTFNSWTSDNVRYQDGDHVTANLATEEGTNVPFVANWDDLEKPVCRFIQVGNTTTQNQTIVKMECTDTGSGVVRKVLTPADFVVSNTTNGIIDSVSDPYEITDGYGYDLTVRGLSVGTFDITIPANKIVDNWNNGILAATTPTSVLVSGRVYTIKYTKGSNVDSITTTQDSCITEGASIECNIYLPGITPSIGYTIKGWLNTRGVYTGVGSSYTLTENTTGETLTATSHDITPPECSISGNPTEWTQSAVLTVSATDLGSGLHNTPYSWSSKTSGFSTTTTKTITTNGTHTAYAKDKDGNVGECSVVATKIDTTKPSCKFSNISDTTIVSGNTATIDLTCTDTQSLIDSTVNTLSTSNFTTSSSVAKVTNVTAPTAVTNGYKYTITVQGVSYGAFNISLNANSLRDNALNYNDKTTSSNVTSYNKAVLGSCNTLTYNGGDQTLASGGTGITYSNNTQTAASTSYIVTATPNSGYMYSDEAATKTLTCSIAQKEVTFTANSSSKTYDGTALTNQTASITSGSIVSGHTATPSITGTITNAGSVTNTLNRVTITSNGTDVTTNYNITKLNGTLTINKRATTCTAGSSSKTYDGTALTNSTGTCDNVVGGQTITFANSGSITNVGSTTNTLNGVTIKSGTTDVTNNYTITKKNGTLTVTPRATTCTAGSSSKVYDGTALTNASGGSCTNIVSGQTTSFTNTGSITNVGSTNNTVSSIVIKSGTTDVSGNYSITKSTGTLTITKANAVNPSLTAYSGTYDGNSHTISVSGGSGGTIQYSTDNASWSTTKPTITNVGSIRIYVRVLGDSNHNNTSSISSTATVTQRGITCTSSGNSKNYDGTALTQTTGGSCTNLISGHSATFTNTGSITNAGSTANTVSSVVIYSGSTNVSGNYSITKATGTLTVTQRGITCTSSGNSKTYDGTALTNPSGGSCTNLISGHSATFTNTGSITNVGSTANTVSSVVIYSGSTNVSGNYSITTSTGTLTVTQRTTTCTSSSASKSYDGTALTSAGGSCTNLVSGHSATFNNTGSITNVGSTANTVSSVVIYSGSTNVSGNYSITTSTGTLTVEKIPAGLSCSNLTYNGSSQTACSCSGGTVGGTYSAIDAGTYTASCTPDGNHTAPSNKSWTMSPASVAVSWGTTTTFTMNGSEQGPGVNSVAGVPGETVNFKRTTATAVGSYTSTASCSSVSGGRQNCNNYTLTNTTKNFTIVGITRTATFYSNGNTLSTPSGCYASGTNRVCSCTTTGTNTSCSVTAPTITAPTNTPIICGFSESSTGTTSCGIASGGTISLSSNPTYYAQTYKGAVTRTITWNANGATIGSTSSSCTIGVTYNGTARASGCSITSPSISRTGYSAVGWNTSSTATTSTWNVGTEKTVTSNATYYAITVDDIPPTCGSWSGESTTWTNSTRTISVGCSDSGSGCTASTFSKSYSTSTKTADVSITIKDGAGNTKTCTKTGANIYVDVDSPNQPSIYRGYGLYITDNASVTHRNINFSDYSSSGYYKIATTTTFPQIDIIPQRTFTNVIGYMQKINSRNQALPFYLYYSTTSSTFTTGNYSTLSTTTSASNSNNRYYMNFGKEVTLSRNQSILRVRVGTAANLVYNLSGGYIVAAINQQEYTAPSYEILLQNNGDTGGSGFKQFECKFGENATSYEKVDTVYDSFYIATKSSSEITKDMLVSCRAVDNAGNRAYAHTVHFYLN